MYRKILIATDGSEPSVKAVRHGTALARSTGAPVLIVTVTEPWSALDMVAAAEAGVQNLAEQYETLMAKSARTVLDAAEAIAGEAGVACETLHARARAPAEGIVAAAKDEGCDLIVMGTHGRRGLGRLFLGSQATEVLTFSGVPVLVVR